MRPKKFVGPVYEVQLHIDLTGEDYTGVSVATYLVSCLGKQPNHGK